MKYEHGQAMKVAELHGVSRRETYRLLAHDATLGLEKPVQYLHIRLDSPAQTCKAKIGYILRDCALARAQLATKFFESCPELKERLTSVTGRFLEVEQELLNIRDAIKEPEAA